MRRLTPILLVDEIEPCLDFWVGRLGFQTTARVPETGALDFVILQRDEIEIMYQTRAAARREMPPVADLPVPGSTVLYVHVQNMAEILTRLEGIEPLIPLRETRYAAAEIFVREPAGNIIVFTVRAGY